MTLNFRHSERLTLTLPGAVLQQLQQQALAEGRSVSNLGAYYIEKSVRAAGGHGSQH